MKRVFIITILIVGLVDKLLVDKYTGRFRSAH